MKVTITSRYGEMESFRTHPHRGIDLSYPKGTDVHSVHSGVVDKVVDYGDKNLGKGVFVQNDNGEVSIYGHLDNISVQEGQHIDANEVLGHSGNSGHVVGNGGYHLHYGEKLNGEFIDPSIHSEQLIASSGHSTGFPIIDYVKGFKDRGMTASEGDDYNFWGDTVFPYFATEGKEFMVDCFNYLTMHIPEIMGSLTLLAAGLIMIGIKVPRIASWYGFSIIVSVFWRMST